MLTSVVGLDHQLVNSFQLGIIPDSNRLGLNVGHVNRASVLEVLKRLGDEDAQDLEVGSLDGVEDLKSV